MTDEELRAALAAINAHVSGLPIIGASIRELREDIRGLKNDVLMLRTAVNDMAKIRVRPLRP